VNRVSRILIACAVVLSGASLGASPATADTGKAALLQLDAAVNATTAAAASGIDVIQTVSFERAGRLRTFTPRLTMAVGARSQLRVHATVNADTSYYLSVRDNYSGRLLASSGRQGAGEDSWATVSMLDEKDAARARAAGVSERTALVGLPADVDLYEYFLPKQPGVIALQLILPPYADAFDEGWSDVVSRTRPDGTTVIRGRVPVGVSASDGDDLCSRPSLRVLVGVDGVISSSRWSQSCPGQGIRLFRSAATYGPQDVQPPTRPQRDASSVLG
jgi:hypothetical protein